MLLAELEAFYSRPIAPTRRLALGDRLLPCDPAPGFGGILLGAIVARFSPELDDDLLIGMMQLAGELEAGRRIPQPRLRHRFQQDRIGLRSGVHRLLGSGEELEFSFDAEVGTPAQHVLCALYAANEVPLSVRATVMATVRKGIGWHGDIDTRLVEHLSGRGGAGRAGYSVSSIGDPVQWALEMLDLRESAEVLPSKQTIIRAFRDGLRVAHPDSGGESEDAAHRIAELTEARRILLG